MSGENTRRTVEFSWNSHDDKTITHKDLEDYLRNHGYEFVHIECGQSPCTATVIFKNAEVVRGLCSSGLIIKDVKVKAHCPINLIASDGVPPSILFSTGKDSLNAIRKSDQIDADPQALGSSGRRVRVCGDLRDMDQEAVSDMFDLSEEREAIEGVSFNNKATCATVTFKDAKVAREKCSREYMYREQPVSVSLEEEEEPSPRGAGTSPRGAESGAQGDEPSFVFRDTESNSSYYSETDLQGADVQRAETGYVSPDTDNSSFFSSLRTSPAPAMSGVGQFGRHRGQVRVRLPHSVNMETMHLYMDDVESSGGGPIKKATYNEQERIAEFEFEDPEAARRVSERQHIFGDEDFEVNLLSPVQERPEEDSPLEPDSPLSSSEPEDDRTDVTLSDVVLHSRHSSICSGSLSDVEDEDDGDVRRSTPSPEVAPTPAAASEDTEDTRDTEETGRDTTITRDSAHDFDTSTVEVDGLPEDLLDEDMLRLHFGSKRKGGGEVANVRLCPGKSKALITFADSQVSMALSERGSIQMGKTSYSLHHYSPHRADRVGSTVQVDGIPGKYLDEEILQMSFENIGGEVTKVKLDPERLRAFVTFEDPEVGQMMSEKGTVKVLKTNVSVQLKKDEQTDKDETVSSTLQVDGLSEKLLDEEMLRLHFESPTKGGGEVMSVDLDPKHFRALITFSDPQVASRLAEKATAVILKTTVTMKLFTKEVESEAKEEAVSTVRLDGLTEQLLEEEILQLFVEKSAGGNVSDVKIYPDESSAVVTLEDPKIAQMLADKGSIKLGKCVAAVRIEPKAAPIDPCLVELLDLTPNLCDEDVLKLHLESHKYGDCRVTLVDIFPEEGRALVTFAEQTAAERFIEMKTLQFKKASVRIVRPTQTSAKESVPCKTVMVTGLTSSMSEDLLDALFSSKVKSGGGEITSINMDPSRNTARVTYESSEVAERVAARGKVVYKSHTLYVHLANDRQTDETTSSTWVLLSDLPHNMKTDLLQISIEDALKHQGDSDLCELYHSPQQTTATLNFHKPEDAKRFVDMGTLVPRKGHTAIIQWTDPPKPDEEMETTSDQTEKGRTTTPEPLEHDTERMIVVRGYDGEKEEEDEEAVRSAVERLGWRGFTDVYIVQPGIACMTFTNNKAADKVLAKGSVVLLGCTVDVYEVSSCLKITGAVDNADNVEELVDDWCEDGFELEVEDDSIFLMFQSLDDAIKTQAAFVGWGNESEVLCERAEFLYDTLSGCLAVWVDGLRCPVNTEALVLCVENVSEDIDVKECWPIEEEHAAMLTLDSTRSVDELLEISEIETLLATNGSIVIREAPRGRPPVIPTSPVEPCMFLLCHVPCEALDGRLEEYLEEAEVVIDELVFSPYCPGVIMVRFETPPDYLALRNHVSTRPICGAFICIERIPLTPKVQVSPVSEQDMKFLELFAESEEWGGRCLAAVEENVQYTKEVSIAVLEYETPEDAVAVCSEQRTFRDKDVDVAKYYPSVGFLPSDLDWRSPQVWLPATVEIQVSHKFLRYMEYKAKDKKFRLNENSVVNFASQQPILQSTLTCTQRNFYQLLDNWFTAAQENLIEIEGSLILKEVRVMFDEIWGDFLSGVTQIIKSLEGKASVVIDEAQHFISVCGLHSDIEQELKGLFEVKYKLENEHEKKLNTKTEIMEDLSKSAVELMDKLGHIDHCRTKFPDLKITIVEGMLQFFGLKDLIEDAVIFIFEKNAAFASEEFKIDGIFCQLLKEPVAWDFIVREFKDIPCCLQYEGNDTWVTLHYFGEDGKNQAQEILNRILWNEMISLDFDQQKSIKTFSIRWKALKTDVSDQFMGRLLMNEDKTSIDLAGVGEDTKEVIPHLMEFLKSNTISSEYLKLEFMVVQYLNKFCKRNLHQIEEQYEEARDTKALKINLNLYHDSPGIAIEGTKDVVNSCLKEIKSLCEKIHKDECLISEPGPAKYFCMDTGSLDLKEIEKRYDVVIDGRALKRPAVKEQGEIRRTRAMHYPIKEFEIKTKHGLLSVYYGDITSLTHVDAVVCSGTHGELKYMTGIGKQLLEKGGMEVTKAIAAHLKQHRSVDVYHTCLTPAGNLPFTKIIHVVLPVHSPSTPDAIKTAAGHVLNTVDKNKIASVAFPVMGVSKGGYTVQESVSQLIDACVEFLKVYQVKEISLVGYTEEHVSELKSALSRRMKVPMNDSASDGAQPEGDSEGRRELDERVSFTTNEGLHFAVIIGDIVNMQFDAVMNSTSQDMDLTKGIISNKILNKAGSGLQFEVDSKKHSYQYGDIIVTGGHNLNYSHVFHGACCKWDHRTTKVLTSLIMNCLKEAHKLDLTSLAFPTIGTGKLGVPYEDLARIMLATLTNFSHSQSKTTLHNVYMVIHPHDRNTVKAFQAAIPQVQSPSDISGASLRSSLLDTVSILEPVSPTSLRTTGLFETTQPPDTGHMTRSDNFTTNEGLKFSVVIGNVIEQKVDALFNSTSLSLDLSQGYVSSALSQAAGPQLQSEVRNNKPANFRHGDVVETGGHGLKCKHVYHGACVKWGAPNSEQVLRSLVSNTLRLASNSNARSLAFPSIGTGALRTPHSALADLMVDEVTRFSASNPRSSVREVCVVAHHRDRSTPQAFESAISKLQLMTTGTANHHSAGATAGPSMWSTRGPSTSTFGPSTSTLGPSTSTLGPSMSTLGPSTSTFGPSTSTLGSSTGLLDTSVGARTRSAGVGNIGIHVRTGDLTAERVDVIVNCTDAVRSGKGGLCASILEKAGQDFRTNYRQIQFENGVAVTRAGDLPCSHVAHICLKSNMSPGDLKAVIAECLKKCTSYKSVAFPAVGTGSIRFKVTEMAELLLNTIFSFAKKSGQDAMPLNNIYVVVGDHVINEYLVAFDSAQNLKPQGYMARARDWMRGKTGIPKQDSATPGQTQFQPPVDARPTTSRTVRKPPPPAQKIYERELTLTVCSMKRDQIQQAIHDIQAKAREKNQKKQVQKSFAEHVTHLTPEHEADIAAIEKTFSVVVSVDKTQQEVCMIGLEEDLAPAHRRVYDILAKCKELKRIEDDAENLLKMVQWKYEDNNSYDKINNYYIERAYNEWKDGKSEKEQSVAITRDGEPRKVVFSSDNDYKETTEGKTPLAVTREAKGEKNLPGNWEKMKTNEVYKLVPLAGDKPDYRRISKALSKAKCTVSKIQIVQIPGLYKLYMKKKETMMNDTSLTQCETKTVWFVAAEASCTKINTKGFDRFDSGERRTDLGKGVYFYKSVSDALKQQPSAGTKYIYQCKLLTGSYAVGSPGSNEPPLVSGQTVKRHDSAVDNAQTPTVFVIFKDHGAYPEYLITCTLTA